jgi:hypothetical protein
MPFAPQRKKMHQSELFCTTAPKNAPPVELMRFAAKVTSPRPRNLEATQKKALFLRLKRHLTPSL